MRNELNLEAGINDPVLKAERAISGGQIIGWRLTIAGSYTLLVWANQKLLAGFRVGSDFTPSIGEVISYAEVQL